MSKFQETLATYQLAFDEMRTKLAQARDIDDRIATLKDSIAKLEQDRDDLRRAAKPNLSAMRQAAEKLGGLAMSEVNGYASQMAPPSERLTITGNGAETTETADAP